MMLARKHALVIGAFFAFSLMPLFTRGADAPILAIAAWRAVLVAVVFAGWAAASEGGLAALKPDRETLKLGVGYGLAQALASATFVGGYALTTVANTIFLHNLAPAMVFPLAWWAFRERPSPAALTGAATAVIGVGLLSGVSLFHFANATDPRFLLGDLMALLSAVGYAAVLVFTRATRQANTPILGTLFIAWSVAAVVLCLIALAFGGLAVPAASLPWILGLAVLCTNLPFWLLNLGMRELGAGLASVLSMSEVVFATVLGILVYGEQLSPLGWMGGGLVLMGVLYPLTQREGEGEDQESEAPAFPRESLKWRTGRLAIGLMLMNGGAAVALIEGNPVGALLAWAGLTALLRLGTRPALALTEGRYSAALRLGAVGLSAVVMGGLVMRGGFGGATGSAAAAGLALVALAGERWLRSRETGGDPAPLLAVAYGCLVAGQLLMVGDHPAGRWLSGAAAAALGATAWGVFLAAIRGHLPARPAWESPAVAPLDRIPGLLAAPSRWIPAAALLLLAGGVHAVPTGHRAVVERLGAPLDEAAAPGLLIRLPPPIETVTLVDVARVRRVGLIDESSTLISGDQSLLSASAWLHYTVADPEAWVFGALEPEAALAELARAALVEAVSRQGSEAILTEGRQALENEVRDAAQAAAEQAGLGVQVERVLLEEVAVPAPVLSAFLDVISADEEKRTAVNTAEAWAADLLPRARGEASALLETAEADAVRGAARAEGEAARFVARVAGAAEAPASLRLEAGWSAAEAALGEAKLVIAPSDVRIWLGGEGPIAPKAAEKQ